MTSSVSVRLDQTREAAERIVHQVTERLTDPEEVAATASSPENADHFPGVPAHSPWAGLSLGEGHTGVALLFAELSHSAPRHAMTAHRHLSVAARSPSSPHMRHGLFGGLPSLAFAARAAQRTPQEYATLLARLDERVNATLHSLLETERERLDTGRPGARMDSYDVIRGASGLGRYLLLRRPLHQTVLIDALTYLVRLTEPVKVHGHTVPGWWVPGSPSLGLDESYPHGHFNLGLAHGICGPLALLAASWEAGVRVDGHEAAITRIVGHLLEAGPPWTGTLRFDEFTSGSRPRPPHGRTAWCYGTAGVARALQMAGNALDRPEWRKQAVDAMASALAAESLEVTNSGLCHGWAGVLQITWRMARESSDERLTAKLPLLAERITAAHDPAAPFGFYYTNPAMRQAQHRAGCLEGAAGIALALHCYAADTEPASAWDSALMLS
ncbi:lanthionine synthetase C family protein [Kitasatospora brasiliensis]|uniref:lanthionine synthetase C family protein n=1 Tax=Kitasatospora brasiliensis TaxID=3058040 RepID=UPI00292CF3F6|nr:lanthionine synthetase C family protein [Kitasatospora sp. K002]